MSRYSLAIALVLSLAAAPSWAAVNLTGDVKPADPGFGIIPPGADGDFDGIPDWINTDGVGGNTVDFFLAQTLPWDDPAIWVNYDSPQNILVGESGPGTLTINGGSALRYQHLVLGGVSEANDGELDLTTDDDSEDYRFFNDISAPPIATVGTGTVTVSGFGSVFNNDPFMIPAQYQAALNYAKGNDPSEIVFDLEDEVGSAATVRSVDLGSNETYDVYVGLLGNGNLNVLAGGGVQILDALMVGVGSRAVGRVVVEGTGSYLQANGRDDYDPDDNSPQLTSQYASFIGGNGHGYMTVGDGGRAEFYNGLSIGATNDSGGLALGALDGFTDDPNSYGELTVTGPGSTVTVAATGVAGAAEDLGNGADLAVGELRDLSDRSALLVDASGDPATGFDGTETFGTGRLRIEAGASVSVIDSGDLGVGPNGYVEMRGGVLALNGEPTERSEILNDGAIDGYGTISASTLDTTLYSYIRGGDVDADSGNPSAAPLRINLAGLADETEAVFTNRGVVEGHVEIDASGPVVNSGQIEMAGELYGHTLRNTDGASLVGADAYGGKLRIRLDSADTFDDTPAVQNTGLIGGHFELTTPGGFQNGEDLTGVVPGSNGGVIAGNGEVRSGWFLNHRYGRVEVGPGESLSIVSTADFTMNSSGYLLREDGADESLADGMDDTSNVEFYQANLGTINVDGGTLVLGHIDDEFQPERAVVTDHYELFRNARSFSDSRVGNGETLGTISVDDGTLTFLKGVYNTGVMAFTGGDTTVNGLVINAGPIDYGADDPSGVPKPGVILVTGNGTSVTFTENVYNAGEISIGPYGAVANFLGDLSLGGVINIATDFTGNSQGAAVKVAGTVDINGGGLFINPIGFLTASDLVDADISIALIQAEEVSSDSLFTSLVLPDLPAGYYWDVVYDTVGGEVRLELISSSAVGADFTGDGIVDQADVDTWVRNAGILSGASIIQGDADLDGDVDLGDYDLLMTQLLAGGAPVAFLAVPEPAAALLLCLAGVGAATRRRG